MLRTSNQNQGDLDSRLLAEREEITHLEGEKIRIQQEMLFDADTIRRLKIDIKTISAEKDEKKKELDAIGISIRSEQSKLRKAEDDRKSAESFHEASKRVIIDSKDAMTRDVDSLNGRRGSVELDIERLSKKKDVFETSISSLEKSIISLGALILAKQKQVSDLEISFRRIGEEISIKRSLAEELEEKTVSFRSMIVALELRRKEFDSIEDDISKRASEVSLLEAHKESLLKECADIEAKSKKSIEDASERMRLASLAEEKLTKRMEHVNAFIDDAKAKNLLKKDFVL